MTLEEALALDEEMLFGIIWLWLYRRHYGKGLATQFNTTINQGQPRWIGYTKWTNLDRDIRSPIYTLFERLAEQRSVKALCEQALALGYVEQAMRAAAALRTLELKEGVTLYI